MRRRGLRPGDKTPEPAPMQETKTVSLSGLEWKVLLSVKEQLRPEEMVEDPWALRAAQAGLEPEEYCRTAEELDRKQVIGRFATFLEHVRTKTNDGPVTKYNGLFHWTVPAGMEIRAGAECGRHICMTHCYWRTGGDIFGGAQIMGVVHGLEKTPCWNTRQRLTAIWTPQAFPSCIRPSSGANARKSSPPKFPRTCTGNGRRK